MWSQQDQSRRSEPAPVAAEEQSHFEHEGGSESEAEGLGDQGSGEAGGLGNQGSDSPVQSGEESVRENQNEGQEAGEENFKKNLLRNKWLWSCEFFRAQAVCGRDGSTSTVPGVVRSMYGLTGPYTRPKYAHHPFFFLSRSIPLLGSPMAVQGRTVRTGSYRRPIFAPSTIFSQTPPKPS
ncbi:hypothetical protein F2Q69_00050623 [Brassica cretica]|uniref:Uncharacterized protein n=1 Tax=Brassica cretica TaxID=69181 RepID=A0A8S9Q2V1_BRACR|nr:hypothetical protein F2Q69_00050623 [Brassica cretica]